jgi:5-methylcytosine-specific restriction endonuclease McrA
MMRLVLARRQRADHNARRRAEKMGAREVSDVSLDEIIERDGDLCYLCGKETSVDDRTLDHVVPLILGGGHVPSNVRLAHRVCNSRKGSKLLSEIDFSKW